MIFAFPLLHLQVSVPPLSTSCQFPSNSGGKLGADAYKAVMDTAIRTVSGAVSMLTQTQATLGIVQTRLTNANDHMSIQASLLQKTFNSYENVDGYTSQTNITSITTQIETSYSLTSRLQQLSLLKYL